MSVTAPAGFVAAGTEAGLKKSGGLDLALVQNLGPLTAAATVFTTNRCQANPVLWSKQVMADGVVSAIVPPYSAQLLAHHVQQRLATQGTRQPATALLVSVLPQKPSTCSITLRASSKTKTST